MAKSLSLVDVVAAQDAEVWYVIPQFVGFLVFILAGTAETSRAPFDLPEAEQELTAGFMTEYSGMKFAMFFLAEYANMVTVSALATIMFLGGWNGPSFGPWWMQMALPTVWFVLKIALFLFVYILIRATIPRIRYDQLMAFGWKVLLPITILNLVVTGYFVLEHGNG